VNQRQAPKRSPIIRVRPTGFAAEEWRVERYSEHLADVRLDIHATGRGEYAITWPDRPGIVWAPLHRTGPFTFDVWDRGEVLAIVEGVVRLIAPDDKSTSRSRGHTMKPARVRGRAGAAVVAPLALLLSLLCEELVVDLRLATWIDPVWSRRAHARGPGRRRSRCGS
jgi:hypothetical protein